MTNSAINALVLGVGGNVSQGIVKAIRASNLNCRIIGGCIDAHSAGLWLCDTAVITPYATSPDFIDWLIEACKRHSVDVILSGVEEVLDTASLHAQRIAAETDAVLIVSPHEKLQTCRNKMSTALWLKNHGLPFPRSAMSDDNDGVKRLVDRVEFPLFAKPAIGKGSLGIRSINNAAELAECQLLKGYVIQEYLAEDTGEFTISTFTDKDGKIRGCIVLKRKLMAGIAEDTFQPPGRAAKSRVFWLSMNLLTAFLAAMTINIFQDVINQIVFVAVLMPIVASMGGVAATQTLTIVLRGLTLEQINSSNLSWLFKRELAVAILNGLVLAILIGVSTFFWFGDLTLALLIAAALIINLISSVVAGIFVPLVLRRFEQDPAIAGSVVVTTVTDVVGFVSFLGLATIFLL